MSETMHVFDRRAVRLHRDRAATLVGTVAPVLRDAAERLLDRLDDTTRRFEFALDIGGRGVVAPMLRERGMSVASCDLSAAMAARAGAPAVAADEEFLPFAPASFDLVVASLSLHWVNDLPGALIQIRRTLKPDGLLLASLPVLGTLAELRRSLLTAEEATRGGASPRVSPFPDLRDCATLLQRAGFALPVADVEDIGLLYGDPLALLRDLRAAGETNAIIQRDRATPARTLFPLALAGLPVAPVDGGPGDGGAGDGGRGDDGPGDDGPGVGVGERRRATLRLAVMTGWSPGPNQPKPAQRGSGRVSLTSVLGSEPGRG